MTEIELLKRKIHTKAQAIQFLSAPQSHDIKGIKKIASKIIDLATEIEVLNS